MKLEKAQELAKDIKARLVRDNLEVKRTSLVEMSQASWGKGKWYLDIELGYVNDEGTRLEILRTRRVILIGRRGGLRLVNAKTATKSTGYANALYGPTL